jgi:hypothetical protein
MAISDPVGTRSALTNLAARIDTGRKATSVSERRKNVDAIKGLIGSCFIKANTGSRIYGNHAITDIEAAIRRSEIELAAYELKQGMLTLNSKREIDNSVLDKVVNTLCGIANIGPHSVGKIIIGVADKESDAQRIKLLDGVEPKKIGRRFVVGVSRERRRRSTLLLKDISVNGRTSSEIRNCHKRCGIQSSRT